MCTQNSNSGKEHVIWKLRNTRFKKCLYVFGAIINTSLHKGIGSQNDYSCCENGHFYICSKIIAWIWEAKEKFGLDE